MNALRKSLMAVSAVLAVAPAAAFAYPPQCDEVCLVHCAGPCYEGTYRTSCEESGWCFAPAPSEETASVSSEQSQRSEDAAPVCDSAHPGVEQTPSAES
ncbi:hypothetical protein HRD49_26860 [Corallococcus exiguus]|uniref:Uncharacterized protein n=1 Tax=Corallococcus exiguus TaxID=83462 RepID=A0A7Y1S143_9BACT|nr:hypothetical protein [Corallococcus exiguus]NBC40135.1 hypothetical protein [Corallococcus exiguus]NNC16148.1 hypothetical protein [Corallococcus exiguus]NRD52657.1 hypothetical protein [Corallococcus exiguus]NRD65381.1 hypothetical protein [Corallococcus exiguus]TNV65717.1 hypothetical protein FH620_09305 [Corallococcus exiguus]